MSNDDKRLYYLNSSAELSAIDLYSGKRERLLPGFFMNNFDISPDETSVLFLAGDVEEESHIWHAWLDRRSPPTQLPFPNHVKHPRFGPASDFFFCGADGNDNFIYRMNLDGSGLKKVIPESVLELEGVSPDGKWLTVRKALAGQKSSSHGLVAYSLDGAPSFTICYSWCRVDWSSDSKYFYFVQSSKPDESQNAYAIPLKSGQLFPTVPAKGFQTESEIMALPGAQKISSPNMWALVNGKNPSIYAFDRRSVRRNLYRIPVPQ